MSTTSKTFEEIKAWFDDRKRTFSDVENRAFELIRMVERLQRIIAESDSFGISHTKHLTDEYWKLQAQVDRVKQRIESERFNCKEFGTGAIIRRLLDDFESDIEEIKARHESFEQKYINSAFITEHQDRAELIRIIERIMEIEPVDRQKELVWVSDIEAAIKGEKS